LAPLDTASGQADQAEVGTRQSYFSELSDQPITVPVYQRDRLRPGHHFIGPALIDQYDATTVICPGQAVTVDPVGNLIVEVSP
jgi:N-methylhydantoinase A